MSFIKKYQNVLILLVVIVAGFIAYSIFFAHPEAAPLTESSVAAAENPVDQELIALLLTLHSISLDTTLFTDPKFTSLKDFTRELVPEPVGRPNPFAPL